MMILSIKSKPTAAREVIDIAIEDKKIFVETSDCRGGPGVHV